MIGRHHTATWLMRRCTEHRVDGTIAGLIVIALARFYLRAK